MPFNPKIHHRRSIRLKDYDYTQAGAYFVTVCTGDHELFFENDTIRDFARKCWLEIPNHFPNIQLDEWVVMPNHVHGIMVIDPGRGVQLNAPTQTNAHTKPKPETRFSVISPKQNTLAVVIRTYKAAVTTLCRRNGFEHFAWQRNYYERIIRDEDEMNHVRRYIANNPAKWAQDRDRPVEREP